MFLATLDASGVNTATLAIIILVSSLVGLVGFIFAIIVIGGSSPKQVIAVR